MGVKGSLLLEGGRVVCPMTQRDEVADVLIKDGKIAAVANPSTLDAVSGVRRIDCRGRAILPGFVDLSSELADPGMTWREDLESGSRSAAAGGFTTVLASPATDPVIDNPSVAREVIDRMSKVEGARLVQSGSLTVGMAGEELAEMGRMVSVGIGGLSDGGRLINDTGVLRRALQYARPQGVPVILRPGDRDLEKGGVMHEGRTSIRIGLHGIPAASEEIGMARIVSLVRMTGTPVHVSHVTTGRALQTLQAALEEGLPITAAVPARNLLLTDHQVEESVYDTSFRLLPPLRPEFDVSMLRKGVGDLCIGADHVPWGRVGKELEFNYAQPGALGFETAAAAAHTVIGNLKELAMSMSIRPGQVLGFEPRIAEGHTADLVIFDPEAPWRVTDSFASKSSNDPILGRTLMGLVCGTIVDGHIVFEGETLRLF